ncbi:FAD-dependent oxidoreductase [Agrobacterium sp. CCNWLW71]|uniref:FAD-dependent oxidoreductase n=1 Tax=unclassified Agrobacterium TaxID=2632611 RepID=UPI002FF220E7
MMEQDKKQSVAIVGSGPSGCYAAQFIRKRWPSAEIVIFEALPVPYGLIRYGVAADHQGTKAVTAQFDRLFERDGVRFVGNVSVGKDIEFEKLADAFDIVVLATGLPEDRLLPVPQSPGARIVGAGSILRALNGYPSSATKEMDKIRPLGERLIVVGNGNVAVDVVRLLCKAPADLSGSDLNDDVLEAIRPAPLASIDVVGRSPASLAKFDVAMLRELCALPNVEILAEGVSDTEDGPQVTALRAAVQASATSNVPSRQRVTFHFGLEPRCVTQAGHVTALHTLTTNGSVPRSFEADAIITAIGFVAGEGRNIPAPSEAWCRANVFRVGWLRRGPVGTIAENRRCAKEVSETIFDCAASGRLSFGKPGFEAVFPPIAERVIDFDGWRRIDVYERASGSPGRCRKKVTDVGRMISIATHNTETSLVPSQGAVTLSTQHIAVPVK